MSKVKSSIMLACILMLVMTLAAACSGGDSSPGTVSTSGNESATEEASSPDADASYEDLIFDTSRVHTIEVSLSEEDRADQLANPKDKTKYKADVVIDGEEVKDVAFHTKGNSSLYFVADAGKDKFSYGLNFGKFTEGGTYHGLDKLNLQNNFSDATSMREYMAFWLFRRMGVDAPLASYVQLTVNGEEQGLYTALEDVGKSFLERTADGKGTLYKPEEGNMGLTDEELERLKDGGVAAHDSGGGADLAYRGDNEESYPDIFENAETRDDAETRTRVIRALKALSERQELDKYLNTEKTIKYFAVHDYLVNYDSYTGMMLHNYYLYENDGKLTMLPWDYNTSFGSFPVDARIGSFIDSRDIINAGIDSPLGVVRDEARPMWNWILTDETYLSEYHDALSEVTSIIGSESYKKEASGIYDLILPYVENDPKTSYSTDKFRKAYSTLITISELRAESVRRQLNGQLAPRSEDQAEEDKVDSAGIAISDLGLSSDLTAEQ